MTRIAFDNEKYIKMQSAKIMERVNRFDNKLYLEFGGKLLMTITLQEFCLDSSLTSR